MMKSPLPDKKKKKQPNQKDGRKAEHHQETYDESLSDIQSENDIYNINAER